MSKRPPAKRTGKSAPKARPASEPKGASASKPKGTIWTDETRALAELRPYERNPKLHPEEQIDQIAASIREFGFSNPILIDDRNMILAGHGRVVALGRPGLERYADAVPVRVGRGLTQAQKRAYVIADNRLTELGDWDMDLLKLELADLRAEGYAIDLTGFDLAAMLASGGPGGRAGSLAEEFGVAPFSVLNAREGWWQERKRGWLALGIQSELGRGEGLAAAPGGSPMPAFNPRTGRIARSDKARPIPGTDAGKAKRAAALAGAGTGQ